jgi:hypothetical protein
MSERPIIIASRWLGRACQTCLSGAACFFGTWLYATLSGRGDYATEDLIDLSLTFLVMAAATFIAGIMLWTISKGSSHD